MSRFPGQNVILNTYFEVSLGSALYLQDEGWTSHWLSSSVLNVVECWQAFKTYRGRNTINCTAREELAMRCLWSQTTGSSHPQVLPQDPSPMFWCHRSNSGGIFRQTPRAAPWQQSPESAHELETLGTGAGAERTWGEQGRSCHQGLFLSHLPSFFPLSPSKD